VKAALYHRYGPPGVVQIASVDKPSPKDGEVLVRIRATTICTPDWRFRKADPFFIRFFNGLWRPKKITILGIELAGEVESVGQAVTKFRPGDQVFGGTGFKFGAHAEYVCALADQLERKPSNMSFEAAAAVMFGGVSALYCVRQAKIQAGQRVLIYGASGSVGVFAVQLARHFGAHVTAVCSTRNLELVRSLGAHEAVDYTREDFSAAGRVYDAIIDTVGKSGFSRSLKSLKRGCPYVMIGASGGTWSMLGDTLRQRWISITGAARVVSGMVRPAEGDLAFLKALIEAGQLRTVIDRCYPLDQIAEAHRHAETGHKRGHVVVVLEPSSRP